MTITSLLRFFTFFFLINIAPLYAQNCVQWGDISAVLTPKNKVEIYWSATEQQQTVAYEIQQSFNNQEFNTIGIISGLSRYEGSFRYTWYDDEPKLGDNYYRIKHIAPNGDICYSTIILLSISNRGIQSAEMYPNPCGNTLTVSFYASRYDTVTVNFYNMQGQLAVSRLYDIQLGSNKLLINCSDVPPALYDIEVKSREVAVRKKIIIRPNF